MLTQEEIETLKKQLPSDWVARVKEKIHYSESSIRKVIRDRESYNAEIMSAIIIVAKEFRAEENATLLKQKKIIQQLAS